MRLIKRSRQCCDVPITQSRVIRGGYSVRRPTWRVSMNDTVRDRARFSAPSKAAGLTEARMSWYLADSMASHRVTISPEPRATARLSVDAARTDACPRVATDMIQLAGLRRAGSRIQRDKGKEVGLSQQKVYGSGGRRGMPRRHRIGNGRVEPTSRRKETHT